jgi:hypothetical protein
MPNWCYNYVTIEGENTQNFLEDIKTIQSKETSKNAGDLPSYINGESDGWLFGIDCSQEYGFSFESKWDTPFNTLQQMVDHHDVELTVEFEESGNCVFGRALLVPNQSPIIYNLPYQEFGITYNEEKDLYYCSNYPGIDPKEGNDSESEICEYIINIEFDKLIN